MLRLEGPIDEDNFWGDSITPKAFRDELESGEGDLTVWLNSPGGSVFAAAEIYTMLRDYAGRVTVKIASIAASAASVVAMAGDEVLMSPTAMLFLHDPMTLAMGNTKDMEKAITTLNEVKESLINAYQAKTGLSRKRIAGLMENESWLNARKAVELGFADAILFADEDSSGSKDGADQDPVEMEPAEAKAKAAEGGPDGEKEEHTVKAWEEEAKLFSSKLLGKAILNSLGCGKAEDGIPAGSPDSVSEEPVPEGMRDAEKSTPEKIVQTEKPVSDEAGNSTEAGTTGAGQIDLQTVKPVVIGMDGRTEDGSVPYEILKKSLEYLI